jgi:hypothetical protein
MRERRVIYDPQFIGDNHRTPRLLGRALRSLCHSVLYIASIVSTVGLIYYVIPGFPHVFADGNATDVQPTHVAVCVIVFMVTIHFLPGKEGENT